LTWTSPHNWQTAALWQKLTKELTDKLERDGNSITSALDVMDVEDHEDMMEDEEEDEEHACEKKPRRRRAKKASAKDVWRYFWGTHQVNTIMDICHALRSGRRLLICGNDGFSGICVSTAFFS